MVISYTVYQYIISNITFNNNSNELWYAYVKGELGNVLFVILLFLRSSKLHILVCSKSIVFYFVITSLLISFRVHNKKVGIEYGNS